MEEENYFLKNGIVDFDLINVRYLATAGAFSTILPTKDNRSGRQIMWFDFNNNTLPGTNNLNKYLKQNSTNWENTKYF